VKTKTVAYVPARYRFLLLLLALATVGLLVRIVYLMVYHRSFLLRQGDVRAVRLIDIPAYRGMITDRQLQPLAISAPVESVWINPKQADLNDPRFKQLAALLRIPPRDLSQRIHLHAKHEFLYLKRGLMPEEAHAIKALNLPSLSIQKEYRRFYPQGEVVSHLVGFTDIDDKGKEGLELAYDEWLQGINGKQRVLQDRLGRTVEDMGVVQHPKPGHDLALSIDSRIQYLAYRELKAVVEKMHARAGTLIVLDVKTGEILGMANQPSYNPNNRQKTEKSCYRNRAVTDTFEPGSTLKPFSVINALMHGHYKADSVIDTRPGYWYVDGKKISDIHNCGLASITTILQKSSNVGVSKLTLELPPQTLWQFLHDLGFGDRTDSQFPGESPGKLPDVRHLKPFALATLSFGYGLSANALQLVRAYAILANEGYVLPLSFLRVETPPEKKQSIIPTKLAKTVLHMLETVIEDGGTATHAQIPGYRIAGKSGTTRVVDIHGYEKDRHNSLFIGIAPASRPRLIVAVMIYDINGRVYYGGAVAAPVFAKVMGESLRLLNIPPDDLSHSTTAGTT
jgi:cell division protein FtsI (penicillin-binding protein 3)